MGSSRFKGKTLANLFGKPMLTRLIERIKFSKYVKKIILATTYEKDDDVIEEYCLINDIICYRGSPTDVLGRIKQAAVENNLEVIVEILGDNPLVHSDLIDSCVKKFSSGKFDYIATATKEYPQLINCKNLFPIGVRVQVFNIDTLLKCEKMSKENKYREHANMFIAENPQIFNTDFIRAEKEFTVLNRPELTFAVNYFENLKMINDIFHKCYPKNLNFKIDEAIKVFDEEKKHFKLMFPET